MSWGKEEDKKVDWYEAARVFDNLISEAKESLFDCEDEETQQWRHTVRFLKNKRDDFLREMFRR